MAVNEASGSIMSPETDMICSFVVLADLTVFELIALGPPSDSWDTIGLALIIPMANCEVVHNNPAGPHWAIDSNGSTDADGDG